LKAKEVVGKRRRVWVLLLTTRLPVEALYSSISAVDKVSRVPLFSTFRRKVLAGEDEEVVSDESFEDWRVELEEEEFTGLPWLNLADRTERFGCPEPRI
jgi:hypothetical protein